MNTIRKKYVIEALLFLCLFVGFSLLVKANFFSNADLSATVRIQNHISTKVDTVFSYLSLVGSFEISTALLIGLLLWGTSRFKGMIVFVLYTLAHITEVVGKMFLHHPSPPFLFFRYDLGFSFPSSHVQTGSSYPSGHSFRVVFIAIMIYMLMIKKKKAFGFRELLLTAGLVIFVGAMLISRISLGEHWASDVIGGALLGIFCGFCARVIIA